MIKIFFADLGSFDEKAALMLVSPARREKALAISDDGARRQSLGAALLLHSVFGRSDCSVAGEVILAQTQRAVLRVESVFRRLGCAFLPCALP